MLNRLRALFKRDLVIYRPTSVYDRQQARQRAEQRFVPKWDAELLKKQNPK